MLLKVFAGVLVLILLAYLYHINNALNSVPDELRELVQQHWTEDEIKATYKRVCERPLDFTKHLPPRLDRRYIVTGGSGLVGGHIVLQLLARGQSPSTIRILDTRPPYRSDMLSGSAAEVPFFKTDITSLESVSTSFSAPWPAKASSLPLTVFHTAAAIRPFERAARLLPRVLSVNVEGTRHILNAAREAGANIVIATSSGSIGQRAPGFWIGWARREPTNYVQVVSETDPGGEQRPREDYLGNYSFSKKMAEEVVLKANSDGFRTGCIRPGNGVYGNEYDYTVGTYLRSLVVPVWTSHIFQNFVYAENVSLAHLLMERALLPQNRNPRCAGKTFAVTDSNRAISFSELFTLLSTLSVPPFRPVPVPPITMLILAHLIELYHLFQARWPILERFLPALQSDLAFLQRGTINCSTIHTIFDDGEARKPVEQGGIGYKGAYTTIECMCQQLKRWNDLQAAKGVRTKEIGAVETVKMEIKNVGASAAAVRT